MGKHLLKPLMSLISKEKLNNMSQLTLQTIVVAAKSKFGVLDSTTNKWLNPKDTKTLADFAVGQSYNVEMITTEKDGRESRQRPVMSVGDFRRGNLVTCGTGIQFLFYVPHAKRIRRIQPRLRPNPERHHLPAGLRVAG